MDGGGSLMMHTALTAAGLAALAAFGAFVLRAFVRRHRRFRRLERAARNVSEAMADGRLPAASGEALLQHLHGLRRICARWTGG
jgi:HAMP domain-containing protein